ncbi:DUF3885 domain-containing protein [Agarivorans sp. TSD2052]|uniref:DUF3885 domain-containing protein n=1 Tax=Agarivorans sp. TSD2052 TaxID=2937286 RepID=UPI00200E779C|nr:DUF3885 domain-containing protein [Agarivorans sp. TSD2052]UPW17091.1 DUF3885 domain-containing protein [Agarivorans sp. TSD2052]
MNIEHRITEIFSGKAFERPVFYSIPGGLRFELSEGGDWLEQFDLAFRKALEICESIFDDEILVCIRTFGGKSLLSVLPVVRELKNIGLYPPTKKEHWKEKNQDDPEWATDEDEYWHTIAFHLPSSALKKLLWCSLACDQGIKPCPPASYYLFDLKKSIEVLPYDDRGMDVVGPNHEFLAELYSKYSQYLLDYDLDAMNATFSKKP